MPELAAHLERVAREVASKIAHEHYGNVGCSSALCRNCEYGDPNGFTCRVCELQELAEPLLAAALAACAREAELKVARRIQTEVNWAVTVKTPSRVGSVAKWLDEYIAALGG